MKIMIGTDQENKNIITIKEYDPVYSKGEVAHFLAELEIIKLDLLEIWEKVEDWED